MVEHEDFCENSHVVVEIDCPGAECFNDKLKISLGLYDLLSVSAEENTKAICRYAKLKGWKIFDMGEARGICHICPRCCNKLEKQD